MRESLFIFLLLVGACIDPLEIDVRHVEKKLIVDGIITNLDGPYQVKLYYSNNLGTSTLVPFEQATEALVVISDDLGNNTSLVETEPGVYESVVDELKGIAGRSYSLSITTKDNKMYKSKAQLLNVAGEITNLYFDYLENGLPGSSLNESIDALKITIDAKGEQGASNLFRWRWITIFKAVSNPELRTRSTPGGEIPIPEKCSGYIYTSGQLVQVGPCTCCVCWSYNYSKEAKVSQKDLVTDFEFKRQELGRIPITSMHFYDRYYIEVQQLSLSDEAYDYWNLVEKQQYGSTDIFQPNAIKIKGNIECISNPAEEVLGFFEVSGVRSKSLFIDESEVPYPIPDVDVVRYSCESYFLNSTTTQPWFW